MNSDSPVSSRFPALMSDPRNPLAPITDPLTKGLGGVTQPVVDTLSTLTEALDFCKAVAAGQTMAIHDRLLSEFGLAMYDQRMPAFLEGVGTYRRVPDGEDL